MITDKDVEKLKQVFATKDDLKSFSTKDDLKSFSTKDDLKSFATKEDLKNFATKDDLKSFATKDDLKAMSKELNKEFNKIHKNMRVMSGYFDSVTTNHEKRLKRTEKALDLPPYAD